ncbi:hypothetical protein [Eubacterium aggregans]|uniref:hypothetical protein n=1 Tax=Eubacterium aggregans TaxID=81409 RepID=UPI003F3BC5DA
MGTKELDWKDCSYQIQRIKTLLDIYWVYLIEDGGGNPILKGFIPDQNYNLMDVGQMVEDELYYRTGLRIQMKEKYRKAYQELGEYGETRTS